MKRGKNIALLAMIILFSNSLFAMDKIVITRQNNIVKQAIVRLIEQNSALKIKVDGLEKRVDGLLGHYQVKQKDSLFYIPFKKSWIREYASSNSKKLSISVTGKKYKILAIAKIAKQIMWGRTNEGWIYISNPHYGQIVDAKNRLVKKWADRY
ncbi:hypothetical protein [Sulfurimonas sp.]